MNAHPYTALIVAGVIFAIVALMHLLRLIYSTQVIIPGKIVIVSLTNSEPHLVQVNPLTPMPHLLQMHSIKNLSLKIKWLK